MLNFQSRLLGALLALLVLSMPTAAQVQHSVARVWNEVLLEAIRKKHEEWQKELPEKYMWPRIMDHKFVLDGKEYLFPA